MANEFIVLVTIVATLIIKDASSLERGETSVTRSEAMLQRLMATCQPDREQGIVFRHRTFHPVYEDTDGQATGCFWSSSGEGGGVGQLVLEEVAPLGMRIQVGVRFVAPPNGKTARLTLKYDPTWMDLGHNDYPAAFLDPDTGIEVAYPSSDWDAMSSAYPLGFELLQAVNDGNLFDTRSKQAIQDLDIRLVRVHLAPRRQWSRGPCRRPCNC